MVDKVINVTVPPIFANTVAYTDKVVPNVTVPQLTTAVTTDTLNFVFTGMGEDSLPNPQLFKRGQEYLNTLDALNLRNSKIFLEQNTVTDSFSRILTYRRIFTEINSTSELFRISIGKNLVDTGTIIEQNLKAAYKVFQDTAVKFDNSYFTVNKGLVDTVQKADQVRLFTGKNLSETKYLTDVFNRTVAYSRVFVDSVDATDDFFGEANIDDDQIARIGKNVVDYTNTTDTKYINISTVKADTGNILDQPAIRVNKSLFDNYSVTEQKYLQVNKTVIDTATFLDTKTFSVQKGLVDSGNLQEQLSNSVSKVLSSVGTVAEQAAKSTAIIKLDNISSQDEATTQWSVIRSFAEISQVTSADPTFAANKTNIDITAISDTAYKYQDKVFLDTGYLSDNFNRTVSYNRLFLDSIDATDDFYGEANVDDDQTARFGKNLIDYVASADTFNRTVDFNRTFTDSFTNQDYQYVSANKVLVDYVASSDTFTRTVDFNRTFIDSPVTQDYTYILANKILSDFVVSSDSITTEVGYNRTFTDSSANQDYQYILANKVLTETISSTDTFTRTVDFNRIFTDSLANQDYQYLSFNKSLSDLTISSDIISNSISTVQLDNFTSTDITYKNPGKVQSDSVTTSDMLTFLKYINQLYYEVITSNDSGFINNQSYFAGTYVEPGYVGTNTYFT